MTPLESEAFPGELAMLRGLVRTLRVVVRPDDAALDDVRKLLWQHVQDEGQARGQAQEPVSSHPAPAPSRNTVRTAALLEEIRTQGGVWTSARAVAFYRATPGLLSRTAAKRLRHTARRDLADLAGEGHLEAHGHTSNRSYTLITRKERR